MFRCRNLSHAIAEYDFFLSIDVAQVIWVSLVLSDMTINMQDASCILEKSA